MDSGFKVIVFTRPFFFEKEDVAINGMLESDSISFLHLRKPDSSKDSVRRLLDNIRPAYLNRIRIHQHFNLVSEYGLGGVHLNSRCPVAPSGVSNISRSFHSLEELSDAGCYNYVTLSPIFDSISKSGYQSRFDLNDIGGYLPSEKVIALGGVTPKSFSILRKTGFAGGAMLGYAWDTPVETLIHEIENSGVFQ